MADATNSLHDRIAGLSPKRLALLALDLQARLERSEGRSKEPIAIIGLGCRFPGADGPEAFWQLINQGVDAIREVPADRWDIDAYYDPNPDKPGKMSTRWGGFLDRIDGFDPGFFGIAPREAASMDPQQRLLMEVTWEALEHAGYSPAGLTGSATGVFVGICGSDYFQQQMMANDPAAIDAYLATGVSHSVASGRLSYFLGLHGPSLAIDTACSSSLVAVHLACQSLRDGECRLALAGGVNLIMMPEATMTLSRAHMMAPDGRCKAFDERANGFVRAEGCGMIALKRLSDALADGDNLIAVISGNACNQDGRSNGLTAPNGPSQEAVIKQALERAGVAATAVGYVETHGTGTSLGDPIEVQALGNVLCAGRAKDRPLVIGSVKTNLGHLEAAAGIAGLIKAALCIERQRIPAHLHFQTPSSHIPWDRYNFQVPTQSQPWTEPQRVAGVSAFGFSGTNAHVILTTPPVPAAVTASGPTLLVLSAKEPAALVEQARHFADHLSVHPEESLTEVCATAAAGRAHFSHRLAAKGTNGPEIAAALRAFANGEPSALIQSGIVPGTDPLRPAFLFTGQGAQYGGMGRGLYDSQPVFRQALDRCAELLKGQLEQPLLEVLFAPDNSNALLHQTAYTQPGLFALEYALAELWRSWGLRPAAVLGHSVGEYVAATVAGVFSLEDGLKLIAARGRLMQALPAGGTMAAVFASEAEVSAVLPGSVTIAALNGPKNTVISGPVNDIQAVLAKLAQAQIKAKPLVVSHAFHSGLMEPMLAAFAAVAAQVQYHKPKLPFISNVTGQLVRGDEVSQAAYWVRHVRAPVRFAAGMQALAAQGCTTFLEIGPQPVLTGMGKLVLEAADLTWVPSLRRGQDEHLEITQALGALYVHGALPDWTALFPPRSSRRLRLPTYPFQRQRHWVDTRRRKTLPVGLHPLLGDGRRSARGEWVYESKLSLETLPYFNDHRVHGVMVLPAPAYLEMATACGRRAFAGRVCALYDFAIQEPLILPEEGELTVQLIATPSSEGALTFEVFSRREQADSAEATWTLHATGRIAPAAETLTANLPPFDEVKQRCGEQLSGTAFYEKLQALNVAFGPCFRGIGEIHRRDGEALGRMQPPEFVTVDATHYHMHPALLDACFQLLGTALPGGGEQAAGADSYLMIGVERIAIPRPPSTQPFWAYANLRPSQDARGEVLVGDIILADDEGAILGSIEGLRLKRASREALLRSTQSRFDDWLYEVRWVPKKDLAGDHVGRPVEYMPVSAALKTALQPDAVDLWQRHHLSSYVNAVQGLEEVSLDLVLRAFAKLGWKPQPGERVSAPDLPTRLGVVPAHRRLIGRLLEMLGENNLAVREGDAWVMKTALPSPQAGAPEARIEALRQAYPAYAGEFSLLWNCGVKLAEVLAGTCDPLEILFPGGSMVEVEKLTQNSPAAQAFNELVARAIETALSKLPPGRIARVIEVGAGTGGTTSAVLPKLSDARVEYVFTDVSQLFLAKAQQKFKGRDRMRFAMLNAEQTPGAQGFEENSFDVVLAANVLHATKNLRETMRHVRRLLAPGGMLILLEGTSAQRWVDLTFGLTEGWWRFNDFDLRTSHPLLSRPAWTHLLEETGFTDISLLPETTGNDLPGRQTIVVCKNPVEANRSVEGMWLLVSGNKKMAEPWRAALEARGQRVQQVLVTEEASDVESLAQVYRGQLRETVAQAKAVRGVIHLVGSESAIPSSQVDLPTLNATVRRGCASALSMLQALLGEDTQQTGRLWLVTRGALPPSGQTGAVDQSPMWGLGRTIAVEHPEVWGGLIDLSDAQANSIATAVDHLLRPVGEDQFAIAGDDVSVGRLMRCGKSSSGSADRPTFRADASYLVTGGFGGMGRKVLDWMADQGARHIAVIGRSIDPAHPDAAIAELGARGVRVLPLRADVADADAMDRVFAAIGEKLPALAGVIHIAGIFDDRVLARHDWPRFERVLKPKVDGGWNLHRCTKNLPLDFFVLFSSGASFLAPVGLGNYAAGNAFLDALAHHRRAIGLPAVSINWGPWAKVGMAEAVGDRRENQWTQGGFATMTPSQGLEVLQRVIHDSPPQVGVLVVDWPKYLERFGSVTPPLYTELRRTSPVTGQASTTTSARRKFEDALPTERRALLFEHISEQAAEVLGFDHADQLNPEQGLFDLGMDSLTAVELKNRLQTTLGKPLPSTLLFDHPNVQKLTEFLARDVFQWSEAPTTAKSAPAKAAPTVSSNEFSEDELADLLAQKLQQLK